jgi:hypothetical protein
MNLSRVGVVDCFRDDCNYQGMEYRVLDFRIPAARAWWVRSVLGALIAHCAHCNILDAWRAELMLLAWLPGLEGTVGVRGQTATASASFADIIDSSDSLFGIAGRLEIGRGRWGAFVEGLYNRVTDENASGLGQADIDITFQETLIDCGLMYRLLGPTSKAEFSEPTEAVLDLYAGARVTSLSVELDPATLNSVSGDRTWADPIIGARVGIPLRELVDLPFRLVAGGDVSGKEVLQLTQALLAAVARGVRLLYGAHEVMIEMAALGNARDAADAELMGAGPLLDAAAAAVVDEGGGGGDVDEKRR